MKIALLGDTHVGARKDSIVFQEYFTKFYEEVFIPYLDKHEIKTVIQLGDFFDNRKSTSTRALRWVKETLLKPLEDRGIALYILVGNHDIFYKNTIKLNALQENLGHYNWIALVQEPTTFDFDGVKMDIIPWIAPENEEEIYKFVKKTKSKYCCGHFEFNGYVMHKGVVSTHGANAKDFAKYDQVYSGHYHTHSTDGHINYIGTPYEMNWSDCNDPKGFWIFDTETETSERIMNPYKMYHKILYNDEENCVNINEFDYDYYKDSYIRVIIEKRNDIPHFENFLEALNMNCSPHDLSITDISVAYRDIDIEKIETEDPLTALIATIENDETQEKLDKKEVKAITMDIYNRAMQVIND